MERCSRSGFPRSSINRQPNANSARRAPRQTLSAHEADNFTASETLKRWPPRDEIGLPIAADERHAPLRKIDPSHVNAFNTVRGVALIGAAATVVAATIGVMVLHGG